MGALAWLVDDEVFHYPELVLIVGNRRERETLYNSHVFELVDSI